MKGECFDLIIPPDSARCPYLSIKRRNLVTLLTCWTLDRMPSEDGSIYLRGSSSMAHGAFLRFEQVAKEITARIADGKLTEL